MKKRNSQCEQGQPIACFARATQVWLAVNHNISVTSGKLIRCSKGIARTSELSSYQSNLCLSRGYEWLQNLKIH